MEKRPFYKSTSYVVSLITVGHILFAMVKVYVFLSHSFQLQSTNDREPVGLSSTLTIFYVFFLSSLQYGNTKLCASTRNVISRTQKKEKTKRLTVVRVHGIFVTKCQLVEADMDEVAIFNHNRATQPFDLFVQLHSASIRWGAHFMHVCICIALSLSFSPYMQGERQLYQSIR